MYKFIAKVKYPYKKEWEQDKGYGVSAPITFESSDIGDYKQYVSAIDSKKQWIRELKRGEEVYLESNPSGNGYLVKQIQSEQPKEEISQIKSNVKMLVECIQELEEQLRNAQTQFTSEDIKSFAISLFIQSNKK